MKKLRQINIRVPEKMARALKATAASKGMTLSRYVLMRILGRGRR